MKTLRFWIVVTLGWFFLFYNIERLSAPINIASFVYVLTFMLATLAIFFPRFLRARFPWLLIVSLLLFFSLKTWLGYSSGGKYLPVTITEICSLGLSTLLAWRVGWHLEELRETATHAIISHFKNVSQSFEEVSQADMYREVRWARTNQRPLALLAISAADKDLKGLDTRFIEEIQQEMVKKYISARLADFLVEEMRERDLIAQRHNHFITLLPEMSYENAVEYVQKLQNSAKEKLGLTLKIGVSTFPEEVTFDRLVECAEMAMGHAAEGKDNQAEGLLADSDRLQLQQEAQS